MVFYGFQKTTLIDYPGAIASLIFTGGCNFRCPYCYNPELVETYTIAQHSGDNIATSVIRFTPNILYKRADIKQIILFLL